MVTDLRRHSMFGAAEDLSSSDVDEDLSHRIFRNDPRVAIRLNGR
jgi:hypothetical protein